MSANERLVHALEVGVYSLQRAQSGQDLEFVRRQVESVITQVDQIPGATQAAIIEKIGDADGQVFAQLRREVKGACDRLNDRVTDVRKLLEQDIDPSKDSSTLGRALRDVKELVDPDHPQSIQKGLADAIERVTTTDGALAESVKKTVSEVIGPLATDVNRLTTELATQRGAAGEREQAPGKGFDYEANVVGRLAEWSKGTGAAIEHVGPENEPGDILVKFTLNSVPATDATVVVEARDRTDGWGHMRISNLLRDAMAAHGGNAAVYLCKTRDGLAQEIGEWGEGESEQGPYVATSDEFLNVAVRFLISRLQIAAMRETRPELDASKVQAQISQIRTAIGRIGNISRGLTTIQGGVDTIREEATNLRETIQTALGEIEGAIRATANDRAMSGSG